MTQLNFTTENPPGTEELKRGWPEPKTLDAPDEPLPYPLESLPSGIRKAVEEVLHFTQAPPAMVASCALSALSLAGQGLADVKRDERLEGPTGLFFLILADSGERKSTVDRFFTESLLEKERIEKEKTVPIIKEYMAAKEAWEAEKSGILTKIQQLAKSGEDAGEWKAKLADLEKSEPIAPKVMRLLYQDATPEALAWGLAHNWPSGGMISSEAGIVLGSHAMGKDSIVRNLALLNQLWDGTPVHVDRRTGPSYTLRGCRLTVGLATQPATLTTFFEQSKGLARGTGFMARFMMTWPESTQGTRFYKESPKEWKALTRFQNRLSELLDATPEPDGENGLTPKVLTFDREGQEGWIKVYDEIERDLGRDGDLTELRDIASKAADNIARIAALFAVYAGREQITKDEVGKASLIVTWHLYEARRIFRTMAVSPEVVLAGKLDAWLIGQEMGEITKGDILRRGPNPLRKKEVLDHILELLAQRGRIRIKRQGHSETILVNPALLEGGK